MNLYKLLKKVFPVCIIVLFITTNCIPSISGDISSSRDFTFDYVENIEFASGEFIVKFKTESVVDIYESVNGLYITGIPSIDVLNEEHHVTFIERLFDYHESRFLYNIYKFSVPEDSDILSFVQDYSSDLNVVYVTPNHISYICVTPNDPDFYLQYALHNTGQTGGTIDADIDAPEAWDIETGDESIVIAIHDTGVDWDHPDLEDNIWINSGEDLNGNGIVDPSDFNDIDDDGNGFIDDIRGWDFVDTTYPVYPGEDGTIRDNNPMDFHGHGTHCSGIASAATDNNIGIAGVCWDCIIMSIRVGYKAPSGNGLMWEDDCAAGLVYAADNGADVISMSWGDFLVDPLIQDAINYAYSQGVILVAAAGNYDTDAKLYPAGYDKVIAVAATDHNDSRAGFSNYGSWVDVAAPGVDIYSTLFNDTYESWSGTSMSTPTVAGLVGLILSKNPGFSQEEVRTIIRSTTDEVTSKQYIGTGRINAYLAIQRDSTPLAILDSELDDAFYYDEIYINGTANGATFVNYSVYYGVGVYPDGWTLIDMSSTPVTDGILTVWDPPSPEYGGTYTIRLIVYDTAGQISEDRAVMILNQAPSAPDINGQVNGIVGVEYTYSFEATDPDGDDLYYWILWGDGCPAVEWIGPYASGEVVTQNHTFTTEGTFIISSQAKDVYDAVSQWGELQVMMPRNKAINKPIFQFLQCHPNLFPLLQKLIQQLRFGL